MHEVSELFPDKVCKTRVWVSDAASGAVIKFGKKHQQTIRELLLRLRRYTENGFVNYEGGESPIRHEGNGVYRIGSPDSLFRFVGFYENDSRDRFIIIELYLKRGQAADQDLLRRVADIKQKTLWKRNDDV